MGPVLVSVGWIYSQFLLVLTSLSPSPDEEEANSGGRSSGGVRWDLVATGICGTALILGAVVIIGIATYIHKHRSRQRHRRYV